MNGSDRRFPWLVYGAELAGTALLLAVGLSVVIFDFGSGGAAVHFLPDAGLRRLITGFLFGTTGALIALSPLGRESGAHLNPVVTLGFVLMGKLKVRHAIGYTAAQISGAVLGSLPLRAWGGLGSSIAFGATFPGPGYGDGAALLGEVATTFLLIVSLFYFLQHRRLRTYTPAIFPVLYGLMVYWEAPVSGTSTNPARSFGPALVSGHWSAWWIYWLGPLLGTLLGVAACKFTSLCRAQAEVAKIHHFDHDRYGIFHSAKEHR
jgi:aquaporin Z